MNKRKANIKNYYRNCDKRRKTQVLEVGLRGFLCTCNNSNQKYCIKEAYNILDDYHNRFYGAEEEEIKNSITIKKEEDKSADEIEDELEKEVELLKNIKQNVGGANKKKFQVVEMGVNNCMFIKTTVSDPVELASKIMADVSSKHQQISRYIMRFLPVEVTCKAYMDDIKKACEKLFEKHFVCEPTTYCVVYNKRYNNSLLRDEVIESVASLVGERNILHKVDLKNAENVIVVNIIKGFCCISVVRDYFKYKKYNLAEVAKSDEDLNDVNVKLENQVKDEEIAVVTSKTEEHPSDENLCKQ